MWLYSIIIIIITTVVVAAAVSFCASGNFPQSNDGAKGGSVQKMNGIRERKRERETELKKNEGKKERKKK